jgi:hypothetical protein
MIDWSLLMASIINLAKEHFKSEQLNPDLRKPSPYRWEHKHSYKTGDRSKEHTTRRKRHIVDKHDIVVADNIDVTTADFLIQANPAAVMILMDCIDDMSEVIAAYRNEGLLHPVQTAEDIRNYMVHKHYDGVHKFLTRQGELIRRKRLRDVQATTKKVRRPTKDAFQEQLDAREKLIHDGLKWKRERSEAWYKKCKELGLSTRELRELSRSRRAGDTLATGALQLSKMVRKQS